MRLTPSARHRISVAVNHHPALAAERDRVRKEIQSIGDRVHAHLLPGIEEQADAYWPSTLLTRRTLMSVLVPMGGVRVVNFSSPRIVPSAGANAIPIYHSELVSDIEHATQLRFNFEQLVEGISRELEELMPEGASVKTLRDAWPEGASIYEPILADEPVSGKPGTGWLAKLLRLADDNGGE